MNKSKKERRARKTKAKPKKAPEKQRVYTATIEVYDDGSINCQTNPPLPAYALVGLLALLQRQLGG